MTQQTTDIEPTPSPSFEGVVAAAAAVGAVLPETPAFNYPVLDARVGSVTVIKHENVQPTGAFKVRGGLALTARLTTDTDTIVTASTGNHAQSIAFAAARSGRTAVIVMPTTAPSNKIEAVAALGAEIVIYGPTMTEAVAHGRAIADERDALFVSPVETDIIHGHATVTLELLRSDPDLEAIYVPIGSGSSAAGACIVRDEIAPSCRIIGVQSAQAPAAYEAWRSRAPATAPCTTVASGLATAASFDATQEVLVARLDDFILVDDADLDAARSILARDAHTLAEGAGAAALAGAIADPSRPDHIGVIVSGGNADDRELRTLVADQE